MSELTVTNKPVQVTDNSPKLDRADVRRIEQKVGNQPLDEFVPGEKKDASGDGKFSWGEAIKNLGKGLISPITAMFSSVKGFLLGAGMMIGGAALVAATGGAILPVFIAMGVAFGAYEGIKGIYKIATAKNGDDVEKAFQEFGTATSSIALSFLGVRTTLKCAGISTEEMSKTQAIVSCFKDLPGSIRNSFLRVRDLTCGIKSKIKSIKESFNQLDDQIKEAKKNFYKVEELANEVYNKEISLLAKRLGVPESKLREIVAPKVSCNSTQGMGGGSSFFTKPEVSINPTVSQYLEGGVTLRERIAFVICHEVRHTEQRIHMINQLSYRDIAKIRSQVHGNSLHKLPVWKRFIVFLENIMRCSLQAGRKVRALKILKTKENRLKAECMAKSEMENLVAHDKMFEGGIGKLSMDKTGSYKGNVMEIDARMYSMLRRLEMLLYDITNGQGKGDWKNRFLTIMNEYKDGGINLNKSGLLKSRETWLTQQLKTIKSFFREIRDQLKINGVNPNKPAYLIISPIAKLFVK